MNKNGNDAGDKNLPYGETPYFFLIFDTTTSTMTIKSPIRKKAHHIPALKIVSTAPQLLKTSRLKKRRNNNKLNFTIL
jgi:hypothetical protein